MTADLSKNLKTGSNLNFFKIEFLDFKTCKADVYSLIPRLPRVRPTAGRVNVAFDQSVFRSLSQRNVSGRTHAHLIIDTN